MTLVSDFESSVESLSSSAVAAERRRGLRIAQARPVKVFEPLTCRYYGGQTHDISTTGLRIELPVSAALREGRLLSIHLGLSMHGEGLANRRQMMPARVVWLDRHAAETTGYLTAGLELVPTIAAHLDAA